MHGVGALADRKTNTNTISLFTLFRCVAIERSIKAPRQSGRTAPAPRAEKMGVVMMACRFQRPPLPVSSHMASSHTQPRACAMPISRSPISANSDAAISCQDITESTSSLRLLDRYADLPPPSMPPSKSNKVTCMLVDRIYIRIAANTLQKYSSRGLADRLPPQAPPLTRSNGLSGEHRCSKRPQ